MLKIIIIGTSHISQKSIKAAQQAILTEKPDCVAVELCPARYYALQTGRRKFSLKAGLIGAIFYLLQQWLGKKTGVLPGAEMLTAIRAAKAVNAKIVLIDIDIQTTLKKIKQIPLSEKLNLISKLFFAPISVKCINIAEVPEKKVIKEVMHWMRKSLPSFYKVLVTDRNKYMVDWILKLSKKFKKIVVVVGAGHETGIKRALKRKIK